jgi:hypothetical protein
MSMVGRFAAPTSMVVVCPLLGAGAPHEEQKRPELGKAEPQVAQKAMVFPATV